MMEDAYKNRQKKHNHIKLILILSGFFLVMGLIFWPTLEKIFMRMEFGSEHKKFYEKVEKTVVQSQEVINPRYVSEDERNRPYVITAKKGINESNIDRIQLEDVVSSLRLSDESGDRLAITSKNGVIVSGKEGSADLAGQVALSHNQDFTIFTETAQVDFNKGQVQTNSKVEGQGVYGYFKSQGLYMDIHKGVLNLKGQTNMRLESNSFEGGNEKHME